MSANGDEAQVLIGSDGSVGRITLNRPKALNALTLEMVREISPALDAWESDPTITAVVLDGAGERGFCAGGDIRALYEAARDGDPMPRDFWREEYHLNARIARYPKPIVAIMNGIVMGGGVGLSGHASHRVATETLMMAMPEVGIGFTPDVGSTYLLSRAPGELGTHLALTGDRLGAADAVRVGFTDLPIDAATLDGLRNGQLEAILADVTAGAKGLEAPLDASRDWIDACYASDSVEEILERLRARPEPEANKAADTIEAKSPTSLKVTLRALRAARRLSTLEECLDQEYRVSCRFLDTGDFVEGVRATVIDKDGNPQWRPARLEQVADADIDRYFETLGHEELGLAG
jgi:enoyl-CoA hydratase/carnithine racemase